MKKPIHLPLAIVWLISAAGFAEEKTRDGEGKEPTGLHAQETRETLARLEAGLQSRGIPMSKQGVQRFLQQLTDPARDEAEAKKWIRQLGSDRFAERIVAEKALMKLAVPPIDLLREAAQDADPEVVLRAKRILQTALAQRRRTVEQALRAIELGTFEGLGQEIMRTARKFPGEPGVIYSAKNAMATVATSDDVSFLSAQVRPETPAQAQGIAIYALRRRAAPALADRFATWSQNPKLDERARLEAACALADLDDRRALPALADLLVEAKSLKVRLHSKAGLRQLTGQNFGYKVYGKPESRVEQAARWQAWIAVEGKTTKLNHPLRTRSREYADHATLVAVNGKVVKLDEAMNETWSYPSPSPVSVEKIEDGHVLIADYEMNRIFEINPEKRIVRQHLVDKPISARPLENGDFLVTTQQKIFEVDPDGQIVWELNGGFFYDAIRLNNGNTLVEYREGRTPAIAEYDRIGKQIWKFAFDVDFDNLADIDLLENGNLLMTFYRGTIQADQPTSSHVLELERTKELDVLVNMVELGGTFVAEGACRLDNGNTLVLTHDLTDPSQSRLLEVDGSGVTIRSKSFGEGATTGIWLKGSVRR